MDTVTWYVNGKSTGSQDIPKQLAVGEYTVKLVVQRDNYNDFEKTGACGRKVGLCNA